MADPRPSRAGGVVLCAALVSLSGCTTSSFEVNGNLPGETDLYLDASQTALPFNDLRGASMDAEPADVDGDGDLDILVAVEFQPNILLLNNGLGAFTNGSARLPSANHDSEDLGVADFDGDGDLDVIVVSEDDQVNELYLNQGTGVFVDAGDRIPVTGVSNAVAVTDLNLDGAPDVVIGNDGQNRALINDGDANFTDETVQRLPALEDVTQDLEFGDVDGDGDLDLLVGNEDRNRLLINDGSGVFADETDARLPERATPEETREADFGDVDGDGDLDLHFANTSAFVAGADPANRLLLNDGAGVFTDASDRLPSNDGRSFEGDFVDVDRDGDLDIVIGNLDENAPNGDAPFRVYLNDGAAMFSDGTAAVFPASAVGRGFDVEAADFSGDGLRDVYLASRGSVDRLLIGRP